MKTPRLQPPQLSLLLDATTPDAAEQWHAGTVIPFLGTRITLCLDTACREALLDGTVLHLPLPPEASPRQIQDAVEAWQRRQADRAIGAELIMAARRIGRAVPKYALSFAARAHWAQPDGRGGLRFHWRLIEQPESVIGQIVQRAMAELPVTIDDTDLFAAAA